MTNNLIKSKYFNFSKELYNCYNLLQIDSELHYMFHELLLKYNITLNRKTNIRCLYNEFINKYYHNEITIKSNFINNVLLRSNNHVTTFEFKLQTSRVDLCKINGKSIAYEIKTDLDNFSRLDKQINDYTKVFDEVYVICSKKNLLTILNLIPSYCGVYSYKITKDSRYIFKKEKPSPTTNINPKKQLNLLSKKELIMSFTKINSDSHKELIISQILNSYSNKYINSRFKNCIKQRYLKQWTFLKENHTDIFEIDYQWFFKNNLSPKFIYKH